MEEVNKPGPMVIAMKEIGKTVSDVLIINIIITITITIIK